MTITVLFDNIAFAAGLNTSWGFACLIETQTDTVLFDTGDNGQLLLDNMASLAKDPSSVHKVFISHMHHDHTGGLELFLRVNPDVELLLPENASEADVQRYKDMGADVRLIDGPQEFAPGFVSTGTLPGQPIDEQSLLIQAPGGPVLVVGCSHPGISNIVERARSIVGPPALVIGGFHLLHTPNRQVRNIAQRMKDQGVGRVAPSHCTGSDAIQVFQEVFGPDFERSGVGKVFVLPEK